MKMNLAVMRQILERVQEDDGEVRRRGLTVPGVDRATVDFHIPLLKDAGWIAATWHGHHGGGFWDVERLTYDGHAALQNMQAESIWSQLQERLARVGGSASVSIVTALLQRLVMRSVGL
jgi:hypothetical protein